MSAEEYYIKATEAFEKGNVREMQICLGKLKQAYPEEDIQSFFDEKIDSLPLVQASELIQQYEENSVSVNLRYEGKLLRIAGIVTNIGEDITKTVYIELGNERSSFYDVRCEFVYDEEITQVANLKKGDTVTILGLYEDYASMHPGLKNCYVSDKSLLSNSESEAEINSQQSSIEEHNASENTMTIGQRNALKEAESYLEYTSFSRQGLIKQLEYEGYEQSDILFAVDNVKVDWNEECYEEAKSYLEYTSFSKQGLIEQLEYEGYTDAQIQYAIKKAG